MATNEYYMNCAFPKPKDTKKQKKVNGFKNKPKRVCAYCGKPYAERHEVFPGMNRQISIDYGFQVDVCMEHHAELQDNITEWAQAENKRLKAEAEREYIRELTDVGVSEKDAVNFWMELIGRNYCEEISPE